MCGIIGYIGKNDATKKIINTLERLEYRGYDSAGNDYGTKMELVAGEAKTGPCWVLTDVEWGVFKTSSFPWLPLMP